MVRPLAGRKIAHLTTIDASLEYLLLPQLLAAQEAGAEVIGISAPGPSVDRLAAHGIRHLPLRGSTRGMSLASDARAATELWKILRTERPDVLHTHNPKPGVYGRVVGRLAGVPVIVNTVHGLYAMPDDRLAKRAVVYGLEAVASRFSHAELVQNPEDADVMRRLHLAPRRRVWQLGNGVDLRRFDPSSVPPATREHIRRELRVGEHDVLVGMVGRLVREKGYVELVDAAPRCGPGIAFCAVGRRDPDKADALDTDLIRAGERAGVRFLGERQDIDRLYAGMDIVVLPSYREGMPRALMEAAAMAKPLIATDIRGCRQVVEDGINGRLIPVCDARALAAAIEELSRSPDRRSAWGKASRRLAEARFDEDVIVGRVLDTYQRLLGGGSRRPRPRSGRSDRAQTGILRRSRSEVRSTTRFPARSPNPL